ncbi:MAG: Fur family transcriptional regulator [Planctomycetota bacterium]
MSLDPHLRVATGLAEFEARCEQAHLPVTSQRRAVVETLLSRTDHPTVDDIYAVVRERGVSLATTYRALETIVALGLARRVAHTGSAVRFDPNTSAHHHFLCDACGAIADVAWKPSPIEPPAGDFDVHETSVLYRGICADCRF